MTVIMGTKYECNFFQKGQNIIAIIENKLESVNKLSDLPNKDSFHDSLS